MHPYDPVSLRLFVSVCEARSIALAAQRECIVPSAISKRIAQMEAWSGTRLLERRRRGIAVTPAGDTLLQHARDVLARLDRMHAELGTFAAGVHGHVRVYASMSATAQFLPGDLARYARRYERVRISLEEKEIWDVVRGVEEGRADIGICWDAVDFQTLRTVPYRNDLLAVVAHPEHVLAGLETISFEDTVSHEHINILARSILHTTQQQYATRAGLSMRHRLSVPTVDAALEIVAANQGIAIVPQAEAQWAAQAYGLSIVPLDNEWARRDFVICARDFETLSAPARLLVDDLLMADEAGASPSV